MYPFSEEGGSQKLWWEEDSLKCLYSETTFSASCFCQGGDD